MADLLDAEGVAALLTERGVVGAGAAVTELAGGVSNTVVLVDDGQRRVVVKQSLPKLKVADDWTAKQERLLTEAAALEVAGRIIRGSVPAVLHVEPDQFVVAIEAAPDGWHTWKDDLLAGTVDDHVASELGRCLGTWHSTTAGDPVIAARFDDLEAFDQLRVDPYYRTVAARVPDVAPAITQLIDAMAATSTCLVHGDFSPKNVLVGAGGMWVLDWEVAHTGDPAFDVAFMTNHLVLKAIHRGERDRYEQAAERFWTSYRRAAAGLGLDRARVVAHLGALLLARAVGKSPAEYLDDAGRNRAAAVGTSLLLDPASSLDGVWRRL